MVNDNDKRVACNKKESKCLMLHLCYLCQGGAHCSYQHSVALSIQPTMSLLFNQKYIVLQEYWIHE